MKSIVPIIVMLIILAACGQRVDRPPAEADCVSADGGCGEQRVPWESPTGHANSAINRSTCGYICAQGGYFPLACLQYSSDTSGASVTVQSYTGATNQQWAISATHQFDSHNLIYPCGSQSGNDLGAPNANGNGGLTLQRFNQSPGAADLVFFWNSILWHQNNAHPTLVLQNHGTGSQPTWIGLAGTPQFSTLWSFINFPSALVDWTFCGPQGQTNYVTTAENSPPAGAVTTDEQGADVNCGLSGNPIEALGVWQPPETANTYGNLYTYENSSNEGPGPFFGPFFNNNSVYFDYGSFQSPPQLELGPSPTTYTYGTIQTATNGQIRPGLSGNCNCMTNAGIVGGVSIEPCCACNPGFCSSYRIDAYQQSFFSVPGHN